MTRFILDNPGVSIGGALSFLIMIGGIVSPLMVL